MSAPQTPALPAALAEHEDGCSCPRCEYLDVCPACSQKKLDIDWCFSCRRLVFMYIPTRSASLLGGA